MTAPKLTDLRLAVLDEQGAMTDTGMRRSLADELQEAEVVVAAYAVSAHIWVWAVLTDRALLLVKGAVRARTVRLPLPLEMVRAPAGAGRGARVRTPLGDKTLWGSKADPDTDLLTAAAATPPARAAGSGEPDDRESREPAEPVAPEGSAGLGRPEHVVRRSRWRRGERRPRRPRLQKARAARVSREPARVVWDVSYACIKCGRRLTNPTSQLHRVGTECIKRYGSQRRRIPNVAHGQWLARKNAAEVDRIALQARYDADHARALVVYEEELRAWTARKQARSAKA